MNYQVYSLRELMENVGDVVVAEVLRRFTCTKNRDRKVFLHEKAVMMEKKAMSRTYIALTDDDRVVGYFTVGMKCMGVGRQRSWTDRPGRTTRGLKRQGYGQKVDSILRQLRRTRTVPIREALRRVQGILLERGQPHRLHRL